MKKFLSSIALSISLSFASATVYYIDPAGNDATGTGTSTNPWKTLFRATSVVAGIGDIIHVNAGVYVETAQCALKPGVSVEGASSFTSIIRSTLTSAFTPILVLGSAEGTNGNQHLTNLRFEGQMTTQWGVLVSGRSNVEIYNCRFYDFYDVGVAFKGRADFADGAPTIYSTGNSFHHNYVWNCATIDDTYGRGCLEVGGQIGMLIYNDTIIQTARATGFNGYCIKNINQGFLKGMKIYNCYLEVPPYPYQANGMGNNRWDFATEFSDVWGLEVYNNRILGSCDQNFQRLAAPYTYSVYYHDNIFGRNTVQYNPESGIILEYLTQSGIIENNIFMNIAFPITYSLRAGSEVSNNTIQKNLMYGIGITGPPNSGQAVRFITDGNYTYTVSNWKFYNNTVMAYAAHAPFWGVDVPGGASATNIDVSNNIIRDFQAGNIHIFDGGSINTLFVRNNNTNAGGIFLSGTPANYTNSGNTTVAPNLNAAYQPNTGSPMINGGINVGLPFTGSAPDVGYYETGSALPNVPPSANAGPDQTITLPLSLATLSGSGTDPDGTIISYQWTKVAGPTGGLLTTPLLALSTVTGLIQGVYKYELRVTDNAGATAVDTMQITVNPDPNIAPTANAGPDQTITLPTNSVTLSGSGNDPDGSITAYLWTKIAGPTAGTITNTANASTTVTGLVQGVYRFELRVTDNSGAFGRDTVQITVNPDPNIAPTANAGPDQTITLPTNSVTLSGSGNDPDGSVTAYLWTKIAGPTAGTITNTANASTTVTGLVQGVYRFELRVTDNNGAFGRDTVQITVNPAPNVAPTANAGPDQTITLPTNSVTLSGSGNDPDGSISAYLWTKIAGPTAGTITNSANAATTVTGLVQGVYRFELRVTDNSGAFGRDTVQITVNPDPNIAPTANAGPDQTITLPTNSVTLSGSGNDPDGSVSAYLWTKIAGPTAGTITNTTNASTTVTGLVQGVYRFELRVTDNNGAFGRDTVQITVNPAPNIAPTANAGPDQTITLPTNSVTLSGSGNDPDGSVTAYLWTKITGPTAGTITNSANAASTVTGLVQGVYRFELRVTDNSGAFGRDTVQITVNPAPNVAPTANAGLDQVITLPANSTTLNGSGTDPDGTISAYQWTKISGPAATIATPSNNSTVISGLSAGTYRFELRVTDNSGAFDTDTVQVIVNVPPVANAGNDVSITLPVSTASLSGSGTDIDGSVVTYNWTKISGPNAGTITNAANPSTTVTGLIAGIYRYELRVTDNYGAIDRDTVQVIVFAPNIPPVANAGLNISLTLPTNTTTLSGSGTDVDGTVVGYLWTKISGPAAGTITNPTAAVTTITGLVAGTYNFELRVTDNNGGVDRDTVQVIVNPENIPPTANAGPDQTIILPSSRVTLVGSGVDVDGTVVAYRWRQIEGPADKLTSLNTPVTVMDNMIEGSYKLELTVTDNKGATGKDTVAVIVKPMTVTTQPNTIKIYPNPISSVTTLEINKDNGGGKILVVITDMTGKMVYQKQVNPSAVVIKETLDFSRLASGTYLVTVHFASSEKLTVKAIKQ